MRFVGWFYTGLTLLVSAVSIPLALSSFSATVPQQFQALSQDSLFDAAHGGSPIRSAVILGLLALVSVLMHVTAPFMNRIANILKIAICVLVTNLFWEFVLTGVGAFPGSHATPVSLQTLACLLLLSTAAVLRGSERGFLRIYLGSSIGSRVSRWLLPILIGLQAFREVVRTRALLGFAPPAFYITPILTTTATVVIFLLVFAIARRINRLESTIRDLTLRDGLTGLYNVKGFHLLGESALASARRGQFPFAVLFLDLDGLKEINDTHGHHIGSAALTETARLLASTFRESDIVGRIGGDEFAVAGLFDEDAVSSIVNRLQTVTARRNPELQRRFPLSFSIGYAVSDHHSNETLRELINKADKAMYEFKHAKRRARA
ncbi:MAG: GGDEF domain-containing protein [Terracidiphilus sp.]